MATDSEGSRMPWTIWWEMRPEPGALDGEWVLWGIATIGMAAWIGIFIGGIIAALVSELGLVS